MVPLMRLALSLAFSLALAGIARAEPPGFAHPGLAKDAERYEGSLHAGWKAGNRKATELIDAGDKALLADPRGASRLFAQAVVTDDRNAAAWLGLARALIAIKPDPDKGPERYDLPVNASASAYIAYQRARDPAL
jgi:alpha-2-macroglobulin